jgi:hypothetical protein
MRRFLGSAINGLFQSILKRKKGWGSAPNPEVFKAYERL